MTVSQTVEIPADHRIFLDLPSELPVGKARIEVKVIPFAKTEREPKEAVPLLALRGSCKSLDTMGAYLERERADRAFEDGLTKSNPYKIKYPAASARYFVLPWNRSRG